MHLELIKTHLSVTKGLESQLTPEGWCIIQKVLRFFFFCNYTRFERERERECKKRRREKRRGGEGRKEEMRTQRQRDIEKEYDLRLTLIYGIKMQAYHSQV